MGANLRYHKVISETHLGAPGEDNSGYLAA